MLFTFIVREEPQGKSGKSVVIYTKKSKWNLVKTVMHKEIVKDRLYFLCSNYCEVYKRPKFGMYNISTEEESRVDILFGYFVYSFVFCRNK